VLFNRIHHARSVGLEHAVNRVSQVQTIGGGSFPDGYLPRSEGGGVVKKRLRRFVCREKRQAA
jgi:hypothetical protein